MSMPVAVKRTPDKFGCTWLNIQSTTRTSQNIVEIYWKIYCWNLIKGRMFLNRWKSQEAVWKPLVVDSISFVSPNRQSQQWVELSSHWATQAIAFDCGFQQLETPSSSASSSKALPGKQCRTCSVTIDGSSLDTDTGKVERSIWVKQWAGTVALYPRPPKWGAHFRHRLQKTNGPKYCQDWAKKHKEMI